MPILPRIVPPLLKDLTWICRWDFSLDLHLVPNTLVHLWHRALSLSRTDCLSLQKPRNLVRKGETAPLPKKKLQPCTQKPEQPATANKMCCWVTYLLKAGLTYI